MGKIKVLGLGPGDLTQMPWGTYQLLKEADIFFVRTTDHPVFDELKNIEKKIHSFDPIYETFNEDFDLVYPVIVADLIEKSKKRDIIYAVPGHPLVGEKTVQLLLENQEGVEVEIGPGQSFIDDMFAAVQVDPIGGFQLFDALDFSIDQLESSQHQIFMQVYHPFVASDLKLDLMGIYPDDHLVARVDGAGSQKEEVIWCPLHELDYFEGVHNLMSVYVSPLKEMDQLRSFRLSQALVDQIIDPESGDAWVLNQTYQSLLTYLEEECQEISQAIAKKDRDNLIEELGDLLMQVLYYAKLGENEGTFTFEDVIESLNQKLIRRHPHIFSDLSIETVEESVQLWEEIKRQEREEE